MNIARRKDKDCLAWELEATIHCSKLWLKKKLIRKGTWLSTKVSNNHVGLRHNYNPLSHAGE